ncbi:NF-kappa-B essential modulator [Amia ocellicauda]|uniref:NF-kappa-B essential modulator n=1 Tax=Amia ocellicauda TaxID=2972642 RepID=UPI003464470C|nr:NEMO protein [Amia calva]
MVQPKGLMGNELKSDMIGGDGSVGLRRQASMQIPPELAANEAVQRLLTENQELRDAIRQSNQALRDRYEEMLGFREKTRQERGFLMERFREARALVERLTRENRLLQGHLDPQQNQNHSQSQSHSPSPQGSLGTASLEEEERSSEEGPLEAKGGVEREAGTVTTPQSVPKEEGNEFLRLLKAHKEQLEEGLRDLRRRNQQLETQNKELQTANAQLKQALAQIQGSSEGLPVAVTQESFQGSGQQRTGSREEETDSELRREVSQLTEQIRAAEARIRELQAQVEGAQKSSAQLERAESMLKQRERELHREMDQSLQLSKDIESLKAQVTSLLAELQESQRSLERSEGEQRALEDKLRRMGENLQVVERDSEQMKKQHSVATDQLRLQTQSLESALKTERHIVMEEKRKLAQLQHAYTQLFQDYDQKLKNETSAKQRDQEREDLAARLQEAERALALKQELIDKLKDEAEQQRTTLETVPVLTAQAEIFKADFQAERAAREKLHEQKEALQEQLAQLQAERERLLEGASRARMEEMQQRHLENFRPPLALQRPQPGVFPVATVPFSPAQDPSLRRRSLNEELPDFRCPKCQYQAPDMDTLQIHVMDCIQ